MRTIYITVIVAALLLSSCIKETFPQGSVQTQEQVSQSETALEAIANAIPASMMTSNVLGWASSSSYGDHTDFGIGAIHLKTEFMLEDMVTSGDNPYYNRFYPYVLNRSQGERYIYCAYFWQCYYKWIRMANDIISLVDPQTSQEDALQILGQAYAYRAMCYLDLARLYEPKENDYTDVSTIAGLTVPIVQETTTEQQAKDNPRALRTDMYSFILSDLAMAQAYLSPSVTAYTLPTLAAVYGLFARAYLEMGYWGGEDADMAFAEAGFDMNRIARKYEKWHLDLWEANRMQLLAKGVLPEQIEVAGICTYQHYEDFFSARRLGIKSGRILSGICME